AVTAPFEGFYQRQRYVIERPDQPLAEPAKSLPVRAVIARPAANTVLAPGPQLVSGFAYSGQGPIVSVEVSDGGTLWLPATLDEPRDRWAWTRWQTPWEALPGGHMLMARATDSAGNTQPPQVAWNRFGYGYNAPWPVPVTVL